jgi:release factor glutamine methyltransferase
VIIINPPYYTNKVSNEKDLAWNCGENFEYFEQLFTQLPQHINDDSFVLMVLTKGCDQNSIFKIADMKGFTFELLREKNVMFDEKDYLYRILPVNSFVQSQA